ncbi:unnamed protein product, partial [Thelazia callipaeda]|uniref:DUF4614 domain-containing protein n=1 Tax=Thelazia callipaeda TaxID=103827 RepID=A0A0N5CUF0_THECL
MSQQSDNVSNNSENQSLTSSSLFRSASNLSMVNVSSISLAPSIANSQIVSNTAPSIYSSTTCSLVNECNTNSPISNNSSVNTISNSNDNNTRLVHAPTLECIHSTSEITMPSQQQNVYSSSSLIVRPEEHLNTFSVLTNSQPSPDMQHFLSPIYINEISQNIQLMPILQAHSASSHPNASPSTPVHYHNAGLPQIPSSPHNLSFLLERQAQWALNNASFYLKISKNLKEYARNAAAILSQPVPQSTYPAVRSYENQIDLSATESVQQQICQEQRELHQIQEQQVGIRYEANNSESTNANKKFASNSTLTEIHEVNKDDTIQIFSREKMFTEHQRKGALPNSPLHSLQFESSTTEFRSIEDYGQTDANKTNSTCYNQEEQDHQVDINEEDFTGYNQLDQDHEADVNKENSTGYNQLEQDRQVDVNEKDSTCYDQVEQDHQVDVNEENSTGYNQLEQDRQVDVNEKDSTCYNQLEQDYQVGVNEENSTVYNQLEQD